MNTLRKLALVSALAAGLGLAAGPVVAERGERMEDGHPEYCQQQKGDRDKDGKMTRRFEKKMDRLQDELKLNPEQQDAWSQFRAAMNPAAGDRGDRRELADQPLPQRMQAMMEAMQQRQQQMAERLRATESFYATLTPEQQKVMDDNFMQGRHKGR